MTVKQNYYDSTENEEEKGNVRVMLVEKGRQKIEMIIHRKKLEQKQKKYSKVKIKENQCTTSTKG